MDKTAMAGAQIKIKKLEEIQEESLDNVVDSLKEALDNLEKFVHARREARDAESEWSDAAMEAAS
jgi:hypothetical protein